MFSIKSSLTYGWEKFRANLALSLLTTLLLVGAGSLVGDKKMHFGTFLLSLALMVFTLIIRIGYTKIFLRIHDGESPKFVDIFKEYEAFWRYLGVSILTPLAVLGGLILLIIPGIIWAVRFSLAPIIVVDNKTGPIVAMKESYALTKGMFWKMFLFWITIGAINIAGFVALGVGLLVSIPVSTLASIYVYRVLSKARASIATDHIETPIVPSPNAS